MKNSETLPSDTKKDESVELSPKKRLIEDVSRHFGFAPKSDNWEAKDDLEILESKNAKDILPYLTLGLLSDTEKARLMMLADEASDFILNVGNDTKIKPDLIECLFNDRIADYIGELEMGRSISRKHGEARKLFCASLLNNTRKKPESVRGVYNNFFSYSPNLACYCGGLGDRLELLGISETLNTPLFANNIAGEIIYAYSQYDDPNEFEDMLKNAPNETKLQLLPMMYYLTCFCDVDSWNHRIISKVGKAIESLEHEKNMPPLVKVVAKKFHYKIIDDINAIIVDLDDPKYADAINKYKKEQEYDAEQQKNLHKEFTDLPNNKRIARIAPGIAATFGYFSLEMVSDKNGNHASLNRYETAKEFGVSQKSSALLKMAHDPDIKEIINGYLKLNLSDVSLSAQIQLLKFMSDAGGQRFNKLCSTMGKVDEKLRLRLAEGFLAVDFGEDFGDALLEIAESGRLNNEEKEKIFDKISSCRESIRQIAELYAGKDDGQFTREYARAANERLTDAIAVFREIAKNGVASADLGWAGTPEFNYESAMEALGYETRSLEIISGVLNDVRAGKEGAFAEVVLPPNSSSLATQRTFYNLYSLDYGYVLLHTRSEGAGSFDPSLEYGKARSRYNTDSTNVGIEASISLITNPVDPFAIPNPYKPDPRVVKNLNIYDPSTMDKVSAIRIDREGRTYGMSADDNRRDPVSEEGMVSVDLAAIGDRADTPSGKIARLISVGGKLREDLLQASSSLNHNTNWFDHEKYGTSSGFGELVKYLDDMVLEWCKNSPPDKDKNNSFTALMEKAKRATREKRGRKAAGAANVA